MGEANDTANRMIKTGEGKAPTLTLDPDEVKYDMSFMEPSLKKNMPAEETKAAAAGAVDESMLSEDEKRQVETFVKQIRFLYKGIIIKHNKTEPTYTKTSLFLCEKRRFFMARTEKGVVTTI